MMLKQAIALARRRRQKTKDKFRNEILKEFGKEFEEWFHLDYVFDICEEMRVRFTHNGVRFELGQHIDELWWLRRVEDRIGKELDDVSMVGGSALDELLLVLDVLAPERNI